MSHHASELFRIFVGDGRRSLHVATIALALLGALGPSAHAQNALLPVAGESPTPRPFSEAVAQFSETAAQPVPARTPAWRDPIVIGTVVGASGTALWHAAECRGAGCNSAPAALIGAGFGAYTGLVVSTLQRARAGRPVGRARKIALVAGGAAAVALTGLGCYAAGGCGGAS